MRLVYAWLNRLLLHGLMKRMTQYAANDRFSNRTLITPLSRTKPRALLHLKSNKVDPIKDA